MLILIFLHFTLQNLLQEYIKMMFITLYCEYNFKELEFRGWVHNESTISKVVPVTTCFIRLFRPGVRKIELVAKHLLQFLEV